MIGGLALAGGAAIGAIAMSQAAPINTADKAAIERVVRDYILEHPEILPEAIARLEQRNGAQAVAANRSAIETPFVGAWEGAADADVTLVEFFDYACGYCRAALPDVQRLLREDPKLRVVYRELPVLGPASEAAAGVSLAAAKQGRYVQFHRALFAGGRLDAGSVAKAARDAGVDPAFGQSAKARAEIASNLDLQTKLRLAGTPSWVVGDTVLSGAVGYEALKKAIADARAKS